MAPSSPRHALSSAAVVILLSSTASGGCAGHAEHLPPVIPWTGCSTIEHSPSGLLEPPTPIGSIDATSKWRAISRVGAPPVLTYGFFWTARGVVLLSHDGSGAVYDPYKDAWRAVPASPELVAQMLVPAFPSGGSILFTGTANQSTLPRVFDVERARWRSIPPPPSGVGTASAHAWTGSSLFLWGDDRVPTAAKGSRDEDSAHGAILDVATGTWRPVARDGAPTARTSPVSVWTGSVYFVWGGASKEDASGRLCQGGSERGCVYHANGAIYDPLRDRWHSVPARAAGSARADGPDSDGAPPPLVEPGILWTGRVVLLWDRVSSSTVMYAYDPFACRWRAPMVKPAVLGQEAGMSGGRAIFLDADGGYTLDVDRGTFSRITLPEDLRRCWTGHHQKLFEPSRVVAVSPAFCHDGTIAVSAFEPSKNTWKTAVLPPVPPPTTIPNARGPFSGALVWTGEHLFAWGGTYVTADHWSTGCENPPPGMPCDPAGPPMQATNEGYIIKPAL